MSRSAARSRKPASSSSTPTAEVQESGCGRTRGEGISLRGPRLEFIDANGAGASGSVSRDIKDRSGEIFRSFRGVEKSVTGTLKFSFHRGRPVRALRTSHMSLVDQGLPLRLLTFDIKVVGTEDGDWFTHSGRLSLADLSRARPRSVGRLNNSARYLNGNVAAAGFCVTCHRRLLPVASTVSISTRKQFPG
jgi:hypothetical protein